MNTTNAITPGGSVSIMRTITSALTLFCVSTLAATVAAPPTGEELARPAARLSDPPPATEYAVTGRGADHRVWSRTVWELGPYGEAVPRTQSFTELGTALHYQAADGGGGAWLESREVIEPVEGGAAARQGRHQVFFANDLATAGSIKLVLPDGQSMVSHPLGLAYADPASGKSVWIAEVKACQGKIVAPNVVLYEAATSEYLCHFRYTYTKAGFEQDLILGEQLAPPSAYGLPDTAVLQLWTEVVSCPAPTVVRRAAVAGDGQTMETDPDLDLGSMRITRGRAFLLDERGTGQPVPTRKEWLEIDQRRFLVEELEATPTLRQMESLPKRSASLAPSVPKDRQTASARRLPPARPKAKLSPGTMQLAAASPAVRGYVLDYIALSSTDACTLRGDITYVVSNLFNVGELTIEPGTVVKFAASASAGIRATNAVCQPGPLCRPVVFTAMDDNVHGETLPGSTGNPAAKYYGNIALDLSAGTGAATLSNLRFCHLSNALAGSQITLEHAQVLRCRTLFAADASAALQPALRNVLAWRVGTVADGTGAGINSIEAVNVTGHFVTNFISGTAAQAAYTNCLFACVTNWQGQSTVTNACAFLDTDTGVFERVGGGEHYLATNSIYRDTGTTNIGPLLAALRQRTTYPPLVYSNATLSVETTFYPRAWRDTNAMDLGYHSDPLDYVFGGVTAGTNLTFAPGTVAGWFRTSSGWYHAGHGIRMADRARLVFDGRVDALCYWVRYNTVQESVNGVWSGGYGPGGITGWASGTVNAPEIRARFLRASILGSEGASGNHFRDDNGWLMVRVNDCEFYGGSLGGYASSHYHTNTLFERVSVWLEAGQVDIAYTLRHCMFRGGNLHINRYANACPVSVRDCAFDGATFPVTDSYAYNSSYSDYDYNAYIAGAPRLTNSGPHNVIVSGGFNWQTGPLGNYYLPANSSLINTGSVANAALVGLYHHTTTTNQVKETNSVVDIGLHRLALDASGRPMDTDGGGVPDYLEDKDGDGEVDPGENSWCDAPAVWIADPASGAVFAAPTNLTISATATNSDQPLARVEFYADQMPLGADTSAPYSVVWSNVPPGAYGLWAVATDIAGVACTSSVVTATVTASLAALADALVRNDTPSSNYGSDSSLEVRTAVSNDCRDAYFRFPLEGLTNIASARLRLFAGLDTAGSVAAAAYCVSNNAWPEGTITWYNKPDRGPALSTNIVSGMNPAWYEFDVTEFVRAQSAAGKSAVSFALHAPTNASPIIQINSREAMDHPPALVLSITNGPPSVSLVYPTDGTTLLLPATPTLAAYAPLCGALVRRVEFFNHGQKLGETTNGANGTFCFAWANPPAGSNALTAVVTDNHGASATSSVVRVTVEASAFVLGVNLNGAAVSIEGNDWMSYPQATNSGGLTVQNATPQQRSFSPVGADADTAAMLQTLLASTARRLPPLPDQTNLVTLFHNPDEVSQAPTKLMNLPAGFAVTAENEYRGWFLSHLTNGAPYLPPNSWNSCLLLNSCGLADPQRFEPGALNKVNYILNHRAGAGRTDVQNAIWAVMHDEPTYDRTETFTNLWLAAETNGAAFVPASGQIMAVLADFLDFRFEDDTNFLPLAFEITNNPTSFSLTQSLTNGSYAVYLWLAEAEAGRSRSLDIEVQGAAAAAGVGSLPLGHWARLGPYAANVTTGALTLRASSPAQGDPLLMGLAVYATAPPTNNQPPSVAITNPSPNQFFALSPTNILIQATASATGTTITNVQFLCGSTVRGNDTTPPYEVLWTNVQAAAGYTLSVVAWDGRGASATDSVSVAVNAMPLVAMTWPTNTGTTNLLPFTEGTNLTLQAWARDPDGTNVLMRFYCPTGQIAGVLYTNQGTNFSLTWSNLAAGTYPVTAVAVDNHGASQSTELVVFQVDPTNKPPWVRITYPFTNSTFGAGADITILAEAGQTNGSAQVTNVEFFVDGALFGNDPVAPYSITKCCWTSGAHVLIAKATDSSGNQGVSTPVLVTVGPQQSQPGNGYWDPVFGNPGIESSSAYAIEAHEGSVYVGTIGGPINGVPISGVGKWDGTNWVDMSPTGVSVLFHDLAVDGTNVYGAGEVVHSGEGPNILRWNGSNWVQVGSTSLRDADNRWSTVSTITIVGSDIYVGGDFVSADGDTNVQYVARLNSTNNLWEPVGNGLNGPVYALASIGNRLFAGGAFTNAGGNSNANLVAELVGGVWTNLGSGLSGTSSSGEAAAVYALAPCDTDLFVGGDFTTAGGDTNANGIAQWDGRRWSTIGRGLATGDNNGPMRVRAITPHGKGVLYVGGDFASVWQGASQLPARHIAKAFWSEDAQAWCWSDLDGGLSQGSQDHYVWGMALMPGATPECFDLLVSGRFNNAGSGGTYSSGIARWRVGYPPPPGAPTVTITNPVNYAVFTNENLSLSIEGRATSSFTNISQVQVCINGNPPDFASISAYNTNDCTYIYPTELTNGVYSLKAVATDDTGLKGESSPVLINIKKPNNTVSAADDTYTIGESSPAVSLPVLLNDSSSSGVKRISQVTQLQRNLGTAAVAYDGSYLTYTPFPRTFGTDRFLYTITDGTNTDSAWVTVDIRSRPVVEIGPPYDGQRFGLTSNVVLTVTNRSYDWARPVTNTVVFTNGVAFARSTNATGFATNWSQSAAGYYTFVAVATDSAGITNSSEPVTVCLTNSTASPHGPLAEIGNFVCTTNLQSGIETVTYPLIREGLTNLIGTASDADGDPVAYQVLLFRAEDFDPDIPLEDWDSPVANFTPSPLNAQGFHTNAVTAAFLAQLDFTALPNGLYDLLLRVRGGTDETNVVVRVHLDSQLKIGQFSFTEQDLVIPVNGIPLTVTRTYNSLNPRSADFGCGWTYDLIGMDVQLDEERRDVQIGTAVAPWADEEEDQNGLPKVVSIRTGGAWDVTLTLPEGRRVTYPFKPRFAGASGKAYAEWEKPFGVTATLAAFSDSDEIYFYPSAHWESSDLTFGAAPLENQDISGWVLQTLDETRYYITRGTTNAVVYQDPEQPGRYVSARAYGPPKLTSIVQRNGDTIEISASGILHKANGSNLTRSIWFERDTVNRIKAIRDPNSGSNGLPVLRYVYNRDTGNLVQVLRLVNRTTGACLTNRYHYDHPKFPHYITSVEDARGIPVTRNLYSDDGRLIGIIDVAGRTNSFEHNLSNRVEIVRDRSGMPTYYCYDLRGNVTDIANVYGHTNHIEYREDGAVLSQTDPLGRTTTYSNDEQGNVLAMTVPHPVGADPNLYTTRYTYDTNRNQTSVTLATGAVITNLFDSAGRLLEVRDGTNLISRTDFDPVTGHEIAEADRFGTNRFAYDDMGNCVRMTNSLGGVIYSGYDPNGNLTALTNDNQASSFQYDAQNRETISDFGQGITLTNNYGTHADWTSVDAPTIGHMERHFDDQGRLGGWTTVNEASPGFAYDVNGRLEFETNSIGAVTHTTYDLIGRAIAVTNLATGAGSTSDYDPANQRVGTTNALGGWTRFGYHLDDSLAASTNSRGYYWLYTNATGGSCCGGSASGTATDPLGRKAIALLSASGLPLETIRQATNGVSRTNKTTYVAGMVSPDQEAEEYPETITDEGGRTRRFAYTEFGQLEQATDLSGSVWWTNQYDPESGALLFVISPTRETNAYFYDDLDNVHAIRFPDGGSLTNYYNAENRLSGVRLASGVTVSNLYDFAGRLTNRTAKANGVVVENASFEYNLNDAVTTMTDNTGGTTNLHDAAGRLYGIDYPSGASVRYEHDLLDRVTNVIAKASPSGTAYSTRYQFDSVGNLTNIIDPFNRQISFEFDAVNRKRKRTLPNGVVTTYDYNDFDQVTKIEHKKDSTVLARFEYERNPGGEPSKITREDGSWVELKYDAALRLTNEIYRTSGGGLVEEISYGYDASGSRIRFVKGNVTLTNAVAKGYQVQAVTNEATGLEAEHYVFDSGGRMTILSNEVHNLRLGYNSADQVTAVTNGTDWVTYHHDATGRRTASTNNAGTVRKFVVAPTPNTDLESPLLVANASGNVQQGYVYIGYQPLMRYETNGTPVYYLEDAMGSIAALADANGNKSASFSYDGFGNFRNLSGTTNAPNGTLGDFRFHGAWLDTDTGLYNMRAREYDARTGRFTSRDPVEAEIKETEAMHPYNFAAANPFAYSDPSGYYLILEFTFTEAVELFQNIRNAASSAVARRMLIKQMGRWTVKQLLNYLYSVLPLDQAIENAIRGLGGDLRKIGEEFQRHTEDFVCKFLPVPPGWLYLEPRVRGKVVPGQTRFRSGDVFSDGIQCDERETAHRLAGNIPRPDFILSPGKPLMGDGKTRDGFLIGDIKLSGTALQVAYLGRKPAQEGQWLAITGYCKNHSYSRTALFITLRDVNKTLRALLKKKAELQGTLVIIQPVSNL